MNSLGPKVAKKVLMDHKLAKALIDSGVQHYDTGGTVVNGSPAAQGGIQGGMNSAGNTSSNFLNTAGNNIANTSAGIGNVASSPLAIMKGVASNMVTQNNYQAQNPYDPSVLANALSNNQTIYQQQQGLAGQLQQQAAGQGPSVSQTLLNQALQQQQGSAASMAAGQRGINSGLAMRQALQAQGAAGAQATAQGIAGRQQEQLNAQGQLGGLYNSMGNQQLQQQGIYTDSNKYAQGINAQVAQNNANAVNKAEGGLFNGLGGMASKFLNKGGMVKRFSDGGSVGMPDLNNSSALKSDDSSSGGSSGGMGGAASLAGLLALASNGGKIGGKAPVSGDSPKNDVVPAMLSPGEIVIPRSKASDPEMAKEFIEHLMGSKNSRAEKGESYRSVLEAHRKLGDAIAALDKKGAKK